MRLLVIQPRVIFPADDGAKLYSTNLWRRLAQKHDITMLVPRRPDDAAENVARMTELCAHVITIPWREPPSHGARFAWGLFRALFSKTPYTVLKYRSNGLTAQAERLLREEKFDLVVADRLPTMVNVPRDPPCPIVFIDHNVEARIFQRFADLETRRLAHWYLSLQAKRLGWFERAACERAHLCVALSDVDLEGLREQANIRRGAVVPPGVDLAFFSPADSPLRKHSIVFTGSMDTWQNVNCVQWFASEVLPLVQDELPDASFTVVGRDPRPNVCALEQSCRNLRVTGRVDDVRPYVRESEVFVIPLRFGSGVRLKTFEALAMRKAIVSTTVGAEGAPFEHGKHLLLADSAPDMAAAIVKLMTEPDRRSRIEQAGYEYVVEHCGWDQASDRLERALEALVRRPDSEPVPPPRTKT